MYYCYLRTIKNLDHAAAPKKVLYLFCSFVIGTIITLIIIFTTEETATSAGSGGSNNPLPSAPGSRTSDNSNNNNHGSGGSIAGGVTFWIFDVIFPILEGIFPLLYSSITASLIYKIIKYGNQGYYLWLWKSIISYIMPSDC